MNTAKCTIRKTHQLGMGKNGSQDHHTELSRRSNWKKEKHMSRREQIVIAQLRAGGKCPILKQYLHDIGAADSPICSSCGEEAEDAKHLIVECPAHSRLQLDLLGPNTSMKCLVEAPSMVVDFLEKLGRITQAGPASQIIKQKQTLS